MPVARFSDPPQGRDVADVLQWIVANVPCFEGPVPKEWRDALYREAMQWHIPLSVVADATVAARSLGYDFLVPRVSVPTVGDRQQTIRAVTAGEQKAMAKYTAKVLEEKYKIARLNENIKEMQAIFDRFELLLKASRRHAEAQHAEILSHAPTLRSVHAGGRNGGRVPVRPPPRARR